MPPGRHGRQRRPARGLTGNSFRCKTGRQGGLLLRVRLGSRLGRRQLSRHRRGRAACARSDLPGRAGARLGADYVPAAGRYYWTPQRGAMAARLSVANRTFSEWEHRSGLRAWAGGRPAPGSGRENCTSRPVRGCRPAGGTRGGRNRPRPEATRTGPRSVSRGKGSGAFRLRRRARGACGPAAHGPARADGDRSVAECPGLGRGRRARRWRRHLGGLRGNRRGSPRGQGARGRVPGRPRRGRHGGAHRQGLPRPRCGVHARSALLRRRAQQRIQDGVVPPPGPFGRRRGLAGGARLRSGRRGQPGGWRPGSHAARTRRRARARRDRRHGQRGCLHGGRRQVDVWMRGNRSGLAGDRAADPPAGQKLCQHRLPARGRVRLDRYVASAGRRPARCATGRVRHGHFYPDARTPADRWRPRARLLGPDRRPHLPGFDRLLGQRLRFARLPQRAVFRLDSPHAEDAQGESPPRRAGPATLPIAACCPAGWRVSS